MSKKNIIVQVFSDIHIESWNKLPELPIKSKYLILAGDIGQLNHPLFYPFLDYCSANWHKIFYVPGNHEFYSVKKNLNELDFEYKYRIEERYKNIFYLNNNFVELENDINIYGTTFWTIPPFISKNQAKIYINDYNNIKYFDKNKGYVVDLDTTYVKFLAEDSFNKIQKYLIDNDNKTIIVTHFPPITSGTSHPKYLIQKNITNAYFAWPDNTLEKFRLNNIITWISGHTHWSYDFEKNGIRLISNQLGYKSELGTTDLNEEGIYEFNVS